MSLLQVQGQLTWQRSAGWYRITFHDALKHERVCVFLYKIASAWYTLDSLFNCPYNVIVLPFYLKSPITLFVIILRLRTLTNQILNVQITDHPGGKNFWSAWILLRRFPTQDQEMCGFAQNISRKMTFNITLRGTLRDKGNFVQMHFQFIGTMRIQTK